MVEVKGKAGIVARVICDSISPQGVRLMTYELIYPRLVHAELLTHGMLVRNAASSRAIPFKKMVEQLGARPVRFGQANPGMQDKGQDFDAPVLFNDDLEGDPVEMSVQEAWDFAQDHAATVAQSMYEAGYHKQTYNRLVEPFQFIKVVLSGTEYENFYWLRNHEAADPTLHELARCMHEAREQSVPVELQPGEWHLPYVRTWRDRSDVLHYGITLNEPDDIGGYVEIKELTLDEATKVSAARCAAVSYRNDEYGIEKSLAVYERLVGDERKHASAMAHQATPMNYYQYDLNEPEKFHTWQKGISHVDRKGQLWSAQFKGWVMHRKLIDGENKEG